MSAAARSAFARLHWGVESQGHEHVERPSGAPAVLVELGQLVRLELTDGRWIEPKGRIWLATSAELVDLWLVARGGVDCDGPSGRIAAITYDTTKGPTDAWWRHPFDQPGPELRRGQIHRGRSRFTIDDEGILR